MEHAEKHDYFQHHFTTEEQQYESAKLGMWIFLVTEILLFGGLFCAYAIFRSWYPDMFFQAHKELDLFLGTVNTIVLISSSVTMALAIRYVRLNKPKVAALHLSATILLATVFMVNKYFEYSHKFHLGQLPGEYYTYTGVDGTNPHIFFTIYFAMTGLHGIHVLCGIGVITWLLVRVMKGQLTSKYYTPMEMTGLYWHLVDLIWIYLFPLLYLIG